MTRVVAAGRDIITTCEAPATRDVFALIRPAMRRSSLAPIALSAPATWYHDGIVRHAGTPEGSVRTLSATGRWAAAIGALGQDEADRLDGSALDAGINFVDTADVYADGESEELLGRALGQRRPDVVLATKLLAPIGSGPNRQGLSRLHVMQALEGSLRRLRTDHIDLYMIHNHDHLTPIEETLSALDDAVRQGKVRYIGCSNLAAWQISKALGISALHDQARFVANQTHYSLVSRDAERDLVPMAEDAGLGLTVWSPLAGGFLSGKVGATTDQDSRRVRVGGDSCGSTRRTASGCSTCCGPSPHGMR